MPSRRHQRGCIRIVGKQWCIWYWMDVSQDGLIRRVKRSARLGPASMSERAARIAAQPILNKVNNQTEIPEVRFNQGITLEAFIPTWRENVAPSLKPSTVEGMESSIRAHLLPVLGELPLTGIDTLRVQQLIGHLKGRRRKTCINIITDLQSILTAARKWGHAVPKTEGLYFPVETPRDPAFFAPEEIVAILNAVKGRYPWEMFFHLLANTGLRTSEIIGLRVSDLDFKRRLIHIRQSIWKRKVQTTKTTDSRNTLPMTQDIAERLERHLIGHKHELVFVTRVGTPLDGNRIVRKVLHKIMERLGIPWRGRRIGLHAFRHSLASILIQMTGAAVAARQLRHSDPKTTLGIYGHILGNDHLKAMEDVHTVLSGTR